jgi:hypothetical protein
MLGSPKRPLPSGEIVFIYVNKLNRPLSFSTEAGKTVWQQKVKAGFSASTLSMNIRFNFGAEGKVLEFC